MALKRLDEEFELKPGTQLLPYMQRLLPSLEGRFQALEASSGKVDLVLEEIRQSALLRMNEILIPATEAIIEVTSLGFLLGPSSTPITLSLGIHYFYIDEGPQRDSFTPSPYVIVEREANIDDYAIARVMDYVQETGELVLQITAWHGNAGPWNDWVISSTPGMADSTKLYHDAVGPMHDTVVADAAQVAADKVEIRAALDALMEAGLDVNAFIRRDGTVPFIAQQIGVAPVSGANDNHLVTAAWSRARMIEYSGLNVTRTGDTMTGPLFLARTPIGGTEAATKAYVDAGDTSGGTISGIVTILMSNPTIRLQSTGTQQHRMIEARSSAGLTRWVLSIADNALESGGEVGSNFSLLRYNDGGAYLDTAFSVNRQTGLMTTKALTVNGTLTVVNAGLNVTGDIAAYRPGTPTTGVLYMNQARNAYHYFDGTNHNFTLGGINCGQSPIMGGHLTCLSISTQGHPLTAWGITNHGALTNNGNVHINGTHLVMQGAYQYIQMYDTDWGNMYIHHNGPNIGFLGSDGGWRSYTNDSGQMWCSALGWVHDYVNNQAHAYATQAATDRYNQVVYRNRLVYLGDRNTATVVNAVDEPWGGGVVTGTYQNATRVMIYHRFRQLQMNIANAWYAVGYA